MKTFQAGPVSAGYENGFLRRIRYGETEIIRMIYFALRDHNWNTLASKIENEVVIIGEDHFKISYDCRHVDDGVTIMEWKGKIEGKSDGTINFEIRGTTVRDFRRNRAGFCVLHPLNITGQACRITHADQTETISTFPKEVAPENPFRNIQAMSWETSGIPFTLIFDGDLFETEDQRNWGDASFKTFCTPLEIPFPVDLKKGDKVFQSIVFKPLRQLHPVSASSPYVELHEAATQHILPSLGIAASTETGKLSTNSMSLIKSLRLTHYRIELHPDREGWVTDFSDAYETSFTLGLPLEVAIHLTNNYLEEIEAFVVICQQNKVRMKKVLLLAANGMVTSQKAIDQITTLKSAFPRVLFGAGTNYNFNEINKNHFDPGQADYISFSIDPQEHAVDDLTILENMGGFDHLVRSTKAIYGQHMPVHISPLTLRKRFNPYATNPADLFIEEWRKADPRQKEDFGALWTFGSICSLARGGASAITLYQTVGNQGILSPEGQPYPLYKILKGFSPYQRRSVKVLESADPLAVNGILLGGKILAIANLTDSEQAVRFNNKSYTLAPRETKMESLDV